MNKQAEFFSLAHVIAIGWRKMLAPPPGEKKLVNEVYVRLMSGECFAYAPGVGKRRAKKELMLLANKLHEMTGCGFIATSQDLIVSQHVARIYTDAQANHYVAIISDSSSASYILVEGSQEQCDEAVRLVSTAILRQLQEEDDE